MLICYLDSLYRILKLLRKKRWCIWKYNTTWEKNDNVFESAIQLDMQCGLGCCTIRNKWDTKFDVVPQLINILYNVQHNPTHYKHCTMYNTIRYIRVSFGVHQSHFLSAPSWNTPLTLQTINLILYVFVFLLYLYLYPAQCSDDQSIGDTSTNKNIFI